MFILESIVQVVLSVTLVYSLISKFLENLKLIECLPSCFCDVVWFIDKHLPFFCNMFQSAKGLFWFYILPFFITFSIFVIVTIYIICVIYKHEQQLNQNMVVPFQQVSTIENQSHSLQQQRNSRIRDRIVQLNNWIQESQTLEIAKRMLSINISTLIMLIMMLPYNSLLSYIYFSGKTCQEAPIFINVLEAFGVLVPITFLVYIGFAEKKLQNLSQITPHS